MFFSIGIVQEFKNQIITKHMRDFPAIKGIYLFLQLTLPVNI